MEQTTESDDILTQLVDYRIINKQRLSDNVQIEKASYLVEVVAVYFKSELNQLATELLGALQEFLRNYIAKELVDTAVLFVLLNEKEVFLKQQHETVNNIFRQCPFLELQKYVEVAEYIKDLLPDAYKEILLIENQKNNLNLVMDNSKLMDVPKVTRKNVPLILHKNYELFDIKPYFFKNMVIRETFTKIEIVPLPHLKDHKDVLKTGYLKYENVLPGFNWTDFSSTVITILSSKRTNHEIQFELIETLGYDAFELVAYLLDKRQRILDFYNESQKAEHKQKKNVHSFKAKSKKHIQSSNIKEESVTKNVIQLHKVKTYPHVYDQHLDVMTKMMICGHVTSLPNDAIVKKHELFDEISIPPQSTEDVKKNHRIFKVSQLDAIGKLVFKDITEFNVIQSEVLPIAYKTNENMLICAPTGAGKTNIALMTIVRQIKSCIKDNVLMLNQFKIVYVCPMKALASEMVRNFSKKLSGLGLKVRELTGDMQMSRREILETQMLITTPEKWDVVTRKGTADAELTNLVKLLIIDEVHLLNSDRGPVIEALVSRTLRQVITSQNMIRIIGLSATLPSYVDVAQFLRVNLDVGLFYFDNRYRSVPLQQTFVGLRTTNNSQLATNIEEACFLKVLDFLKDGHQVMVFVHARNQTSRTARYLMEAASKRKLSNLFVPPRTIGAKKMYLAYKDLTNKQLSELLEFGIGIHHAGMLRHDRSTVEKLFLEGLLKVVVCTATLAWGVNLPAHGVIIKGTEIYDSKKGSFVDLDVLDVLQIFGRAGRPQFDTSGHGVIITTSDKVKHYLSALTNRIPIESNFLKKLPENLNAEIVLGTIPNIQEAVEWLTYTYMHRRMLVNPLVYGIPAEAFYEDPRLQAHLLQLLHNAAKELDKARMIRYDVETGELTSTYLGRTASYFYINLSTILTFNEKMASFSTEADIIKTMCLASEFSDMQVRKEDLEELDELAEEYAVFPVMSVENTHGKVFLLMQTYLTRGQIKSMSLASDVIFINQSAARIARALFDIALHRHQATLTGRCLIIAQAFEQQMWPDQTPLRQFSYLNMHVIHQIESKHVDIYRLKTMSATEIGDLVRNVRSGTYVKHCVDSFPQLVVDSQLMPITRGVLRVRLFITPIFTWTDKFNGSAVENFWIWVEDPETDSIYYSETCAISKSQCINQEVLELVFTVPLAEDHASQYLVRIVSDKWMHAVHVHPLSFRDLHIPSSFTPHTDLLPLEPLPVQALHNEKYQSLYRFKHFNSVQTQIFHCLYHTDNNVLLGAPTGSGKTIAAEICMFRLFNKKNGLKVVYIAPLKALVRERVADWGKKLQVLGKKVLEVTGDVTPNAKELHVANVIITTPEKWDAMSRGWQNRQYIRDVGLIVIDEIHLLGEDRGPVLEVIISRTNFIADQSRMKPRIIGLSTAIANAGDLAHWLGVGEMGLYNFRPSVRPVPIETHIKGFPGKHYCPRMISMNRPTYQAIRRFAPDSPTLIFCSSRKQTRLTAFDLVTFLLTDAESKQWLHCDEDSIDYIVSNVSNQELKQFLPFGIGIHHAGLQENDRKVVEELFVNQKIQVLIATATLAWGVNFPAHLVVIKGTEYYDGRTKRYVDMPITDVLQMMGRAGRPQFDTYGVACVFVQDVKKTFYKKFLYEPFPIESNLMTVLPDHINAEIASQTITSKTKLLEYMTWTFYFRRLLQNPSYYNLSSVEPKDVNKFLNNLVDSVIEVLVDADCISVSEENTYDATYYGQISCHYYLSYKTMILFQNELKYNSSIFELLSTMCHSEEYALFPVRHNEDKINKEIAHEMKFEHKENNYDSPYVKVFLLIHAYLTSFELPNQEYIVDLKSIMDQTLRITQAMMDIVANNGWLSCTLKIISIMQMLIQGHYLYESTLLTIPHVNRTNFQPLGKEIRKMFYSEDANRSVTVMDMKFAYRNHKQKMTDVIYKMFESRQAKEILDFLDGLPLIEVIVTTVGEGEDQVFTQSERPVINMKPNHEYVLQFKLFRTGFSKLNVQGSKFTKQRDEGWYVIVGDAGNDNLFNMKRVGFRKSTTCSLTITSPVERGNYTYSFYVMSDSYLGLDQQYEILLKVL